jgi:DNA topoisomerase-1
MTRPTRHSPADLRREVDHRDPHDSARLAGLRHSSDDRPGIARRRAGRGFTYRGPDGRTIRDERTLARIRALAVPPAWTDVWISTDPTGHLQATGRDARGRKQYRYHARWRARRDDDKFERILAFAGLLPRIRRRVNRDLARRSLTREKVVAAVVRLLELTLIRVGNDEYARLNRSFGLTTLKDRHAIIQGSTVRFRFRGKSGREHDVDIRDRRLAGIVRRCRELPGQELFQYLDDEGRPQDVTSDDVNAYLRDAAGADVTARDFRIWAGTVLAYRALCASGVAGDERSARRAVVEAVRISADALGNTAAVARRSYVHPAVLEAYLDGAIEPQGRQASATTDRPTPSNADRFAEAAVLRLLRRPLARDARRSSAAAGRATAG